MDVRLRVSLMVDGADYSGVPTDQATWENDVIWNGPGKKPLWAEIVAADQLEVDYVAKEAARDLLNDTDKDMARVAEDVIGALVGKGLIAMADFPVGVTDKIAARAAARAKL